MDGFEIDVNFVDSESMRIAALYDIHGNLSALQSVLRDVETVGVDRIVVGGDVIPGPQPLESLSTLMNLSIPTDFIRGNGEREVFATLQGNASDKVPEPYRKAMEWVGQQFDLEQLQWMNDWPTTVQHSIDGLGEVEFCHATPQNDVDLFTRLTPTECLLPIFRETSSDIVVCGHTHMQFQRVVGRTVVANAGSVGMPFGKPGAFWLLLGPELEFRNSDYDRTAASAQICETNYPMRDDFAERNVLAVPDEAEMLELFERNAVG